MVIHLKKRLQLYLPISSSCFICPFYGTISPMVSFKTFQSFLSVMIVHKIIFIAILSSFLFVAPVGAVPIDTEPSNAELVLTPEASATPHDLSVIKLPVPPSQMSPSIGFIPQAVSMNTAAGFFRTLLSSLTYEVKFTSLGRLYTAIPPALNTKNHALFSSRLLPHPEKLQSTALLNNNKLVDFKKAQLPLRSQESNMFFGPAFWLGIMSLILVGTMAVVVWGSRRIIILNI